MKRPLALSAAFVICILFKANAQSATANSSSYATGLGLKFYPTAVTLKHFISEDRKALEFLGYLYNYGSRVAVLYEIHANIPGVDGLKWYVGPGAHLGFYNSKYGGGATLGIDGVLGLDYKIHSLPINVSLDWQPSFEFGNKFNNGFTGDWGGLGIRYTF